MIRVKTFLLILFAATISACGIGASSSTSSPSTPESRANAGEELFMRYCATCHGESASGNGPASASLKQPPANLRQIATRNSGTFIAHDVAAYIDGRSRVMAHGSPEMPIWGRKLDDRTEKIAEETKLAPGSIYLIVEYLRSIQE